jgi:hypothetical protein
VVLVLRVRHLPAPTIAELFVAGWLTTLNSRIKDGTLVGDDLWPKLSSIGLATDCNTKPALLVSRFRLSSSRYDRKLCIGDFLKNVVYLPFESNRMGSRRGNAGEGKDTPMRRIHQDNEVREELLLCDLDEIARQGARRMLIEALQAEVEEYVEAASSERDHRGHALVARNARAREREVVVGARALKVRAPRVNDRRMDEDGRRRRFSSSILPPYMRRSPKVSEVLPLL